MLSNASVFGESLCANYENFPSASFIVSQFFVFDCSARRGQRKLSCTVYNSFLLRTTVSSPTK